MEGSEEAPKTPPASSKQSQQASASSSGNDNGEATTIPESPEKRACRYCLCGDGDEDEGDDEQLVSACACRGDQRWVHLSCLRKWQRQILICQPTHPAFYSNDKRHELCSVCRTNFTFAPPSRAELMRELTGEEMASMLNIGFLLVSDRKSSLKLSSILFANSHIPEVLDLRHWMCGVFLIFQIEKESAQDDTDCIYAFNLTRQIVPREMHILVENAAKDNLRSVYSDFRDEDVSIHHFNGGPCESRRANAVALLQYTKREEIEARGGLRQIMLEWGADNPWNMPAGLLVLGQPHEILEDAYMETLDIRAKEGTTAAAASGSGGGGGGGGDPVPGNFHPVVPVHFYWGTATWSRTQLLGEIARGNWGMCRAASIDACHALRLPLPDGVLFRPPESSDNEDGNEAEGANGDESPVVVAVPPPPPPPCGSSSNEGEHVELLQDYAAPRRLWQQVYLSGRLSFAPIGDMTSDISEDEEEQSESEEEEEEGHGDDDDSEREDSGNHGGGGGDSTEEQIRRLQQQQRRDVLARAQRDREDQERRQRESQEAQQAAQEGGGGGGEEEEEQEEEEGRTRSLSSSAISNVATVGPPAMAEAAPAAAVHAHQKRKHGDEAESTQLASASGGTGENELPPKQKKERRSLEVALAGKKLLLQALSGGVGGGGGGAGATAETEGTSRGDDDNDDDDSVDSDVSSEEEENSKSKSNEESES